MTIETLVWYDGTWFDKNQPVAGPRSHGLWLGSAVFDGARRFEGTMPDLNAHIDRAVASAKTLGLDPKISTHKIISLVHEGASKFPDDAALYIKPVFWPESGGYQAAIPDPDTTRFALCIYDEPMPSPGTCAVTLSPHRRSTYWEAPVDAKASCLYPNTARAMREAASRGFQNCVVMDQNGNVCELASANLFFTRGDTVMTPVPNGCFLDGITRRRVIGLLRDHGVTVVEKTVRYQELLDADEIFSTGNFAKVMPVTRIEERELGQGPMMKLTRELYWSFAHSELTALDKVS